MEKTAPSSSLPTPKVLLRPRADMLAVNEFGLNDVLPKKHPCFDQKQKFLCTLDLVRPAPRLRYWEWDERPLGAGFSILGALM